MNLARLTLLNKNSSPAWLLVFLVLLFGKQAIASDLDLLTEDQQQRVYQRMAEIERQRGMALYQDQQQRQLTESSQSIQSIQSTKSSQPTKPRQPTQSIAAMIENNNQSEIEAIELQIEKSQASLMRQSVDETGSRGSSQSSNQSDLSELSGSSRLAQLTQLASENNASENSPQSDPLNNQSDGVALKEVIRLTFEQSELYKIAQEQLTQANLSASALDSSSLPNVNAALNSNQSKSNNSPSQSNSSFSLDLTQTIWQPLSADMSSEQAALTRQLAGFNYQKSQSDLINTAATEFLNVLKSRYQIDYAKATFKGAEDTLRTAEILFQSGQTSGLELLRSQSAFDVAKANLLAANQDYSRKLTTLGNLIDIPIEDVSPSGMENLLSLANQFKQQSENQWLSQIGENNPDLKIAFVEVQLARVSVQSAEKKYAPELQLRANTTQYLSNNLNSDSNNNTSLGLSFSLPLYQGGNKQINLDNFKSLLNESQLNYDLLKKELRFRLLDLEQRKSYLDQLIIAYENAEKSLKSQLERTIEAYRSGVSEVNDVNEATTNYAGAELNLKLAKVDQMINFIALNHLLGALSQERVISLL